MTRMLMLGTLALAGCSYSGTFEMTGGVTFPAQRTTLGCVDLGVGPHRTSRRSAPVVDLMVGNRCDHRVPLDLTTLRVHGRTLGGDVVVLAPLEPRRLADVELAGRWMAREVIELDVGPDEVRVHEICVDVGAIERSAQVGERWLCMAPVGARVGGAS